MSHRTFSVNFLVFFGFLLSALAQDEEGDPGGEGSGGGDIIPPITVAPTFDPHTEGEFVDYGKLSLNRKLLEGSRWDVEKTQKKEKINVYHSMEILEIDKVNVDMMSIGVELMLQQRWVAEDLVLPTGLFLPDDAPNQFVTTGPAILDSIWSPMSIFIDSRKTAIGGFGVPHAIVRIFQNKTIVYRAKVTVLLGCKFSFEWYPLDTQRCDLSLESFAFTKRTVRYLFESPEVTAPFIMNDISLYQYSLRTPVEYVEDTADHWGRKAKYPRITVKFIFERQIGFNMIQTFIPMYLVIILSWFSFWLGLDAIPGRVTLLITCLLTIVTMHASNRSGIPPVNYIKMMDIWMVTCMAFVFLALCEFVLVNYLKSREGKGNEKPDELVTLILQMQKKLKGQMGNKKSLHPYLEFYGNLGAYPKPQEEEYRIALVLQENPPKRVNDTLRNRFGGFGGPPPPPFPNYPMGESFPQNMYGPNGPTIPPQTASKRPLWKEIDRWSRLLFPVAFVIFNCVYWPILFNGDSRQ